MTAEPVSSDEGREGLTQAESAHLWEAIERAFLDTTTWNRAAEEAIDTAMERILADRLAAVQAEAHEWQRLFNDAEAALDAARREVEGLRAERDLLRETLRIGTELDNHHNADACPYCTGGIRAQRDDLRARLGALAEKREQDFIGFTRAAENAASVGDDSTANWALNIAAIYGADANALRAALANPSADEDRTPTPYDPDDPDEAEFLGIGPPAVQREEGRRLASQRDDLIAQGVNPADLAVPLGPDIGDHGRHSDETNGDD